jgi:predicted GNAT family acetyltransferase
MTDRRPASDAANPELTIRDHPAANRYEAWLGRDLAGWVDYRRVRGRLVAIHTEVPEAFGGRGIGSALIRRVLDDAREAGLKITPRCPFFVAHFKRHPEDEDLIELAPGERGRS